MQAFGNKKINNESLSQYKLFRTLKFKKNKWASDNLFEQPKSLIY
jgi:hypothetical protein